jgi:hypothetical protein
MSERAKGLQTATLEASQLEQELETRFAELPAAVWVDCLRQAGMSAYAVGLGINCLRSAVVE